MNWTKYEQHKNECAESSDSNIRKVAAALGVGAHVRGGIIWANGRREWLTRHCGCFDLTGVRAADARSWWRRIREIGGIRNDSGKCVDPSLRSLQFMVRRDSPVLAD